MVFMKKLLVVVFLLGTYLGVQAQTMSAEEQAAAIARLTEEVNALKAKSEKHDKWEKVISKMPKISGYVMGRYTYAGDESTFRLRRVRLSIAGNIIPDMEYKLQAELSSFKLLDAYVDYKPFKQLQVKAGQFKIPFTIENTDYTPTKMVMIDHPMVLDRLVGSKEKIGATTLSDTGRELGINLHGGFCENKIQYDLAIFNGNELNKTDNNKSKDVVGRLRVTPVEGLTLSGSYYWGEFDEQFYARERWSIGGVYDKNALLLRAEYVGGTTGFQQGEIDSEGWYALAAWRLCEGKWTVAARYDTFTDKASEFSPKVEQGNYTLGVAWKPCKYLRFQANYVYEDKNVGHRNVAMVQATASF